MSARNTCSLLLSTPQFILLRSLRSSKPCESSEHTFPFVENCRNHRCSVGKSSQRTASTSYLWHGAHTRKRGSKKEEEKEPEKGTSKRKYASLVFCLEQRKVESLHKEEASHSLHSKSWLPNEIYFSLLLLPTRLHTDMEKNLSQPPSHDQKIQRVEEVEKV